MTTGKSTQTILAALTDEERRFCTPLDKLGVRIARAMSGPECLKACREIYPDVIVIGKGLANPSSFEVIRQIRIDRGTSEVPIVYLTKDTDPVERIGAFECGATIVARMPFENADEFMAQISSLLRLAADSHRLIEDARNQCISLTSGVLTHDLNQPLTFLLGYLSIIRERPERAGDRELIERMIAECRRAAGIVEQLGGKNQAALAEYAREINIIRHAERPQAYTCDVLFVDDEEALRIVFKEAVSMIGYSVKCVAGAMEAIAELEAERPKVVVSDLNMAGMDGIELYHEVKRRWKDLPFVFLTGYEIKEREKNIIEQSHGFVRKPFHLDDIQSLLEKLGITPFQSVSA